MSTKVVNSQFISYIRLLALVSISKINNEFYVDVAIDFAIKSGLNFQVHEVEQYICWGTPQDYEQYQHWLKYFKIRLKS